MQYTCTCSPTHTKECSKERSGLPSRCQFQKVWYPDQYNLVTKHYIDLAHLRDQERVEATAIRWTTFVEYVQRKTDLLKLTSEPEVCSRILYGGVCKYY